MDLISLSFLLSYPLAPRPLPRVCLCVRPVSVHVYVSRLLAAADTFSGPSWHQTELCLGVSSGAIVAPVQRAFTWDLAISTHFKG